MPTGYPARHVGREVHQLLVLYFLHLLFLIISFRETALFVQVKAIITGEALKQSAHREVFGLNTKQEMTSVKATINRIDPYF